MPFPPNVHPTKVIAPKSRLKFPHAIYAGPNWSLAVGLWDGSRQMLIRWNDDPTKSLGNPVSHGRPTWFVLPDAFYRTALDHLCKTAKGRADTATNWLNGEGPDEWPYETDEFPDA